MEYFSRLEKRIILITVILSKCERSIAGVDGGLHPHNTDAEHENQIDPFPCLELESKEHRNGQADEPQIRSDVDCLGSVS